MAHELHNTHRALASPGGGDARMPNPFESMLGCAGHSNPCLAVYYSYYSYYSHVFMQFHHFHRFHSSPYTTTRANARWSAAESIRIRTLASRRQAGAMPNPFEFAGALPNPFEFLSLSSIRMKIDTRSRSPEHLLTSYPIVFLSAAESIRIHAWSLV